MSFTSGKIKHDPMPYVWPNVESRLTSGPLRSMFSHGDGIALTYAPRPELDHHNPILVRFRKWVEGEDLSDPYWSERWLDALTAFDLFGGHIGWDNKRHVFHVIVEASDGQRDHARRVLTKLAHLSEVA